MVLTGEAAWNSFFFREERSWGPWQHPSSLLSLRLLSLPAESGRTMGVNKQLARWCLSKGVGFVDNWNFSLGIKSVIQESQPAFQSSTSRQTISGDNYLAFFFFPSSFSLPLPFPKPVDTDLGSEKQRIPRVRKNILPNTLSRKLSVTYSDAEFNNYTPTAELIPMK